MLSASADGCRGSRSTPHSFLALDERWPIGAHRQAPAPDQGQDVRASAAHRGRPVGAGRSGLPQLETLLTAVASAEAAAIGAHLHVISGDEAVLEAADGHPNVSWERIAGQAHGLSGQLRAANADIVHLLCHGGAAAGLRRLAFATMADVDAVAGGASAEEAVGSLWLSVPALVNALASSDPWLLVLSACDTAEAAAGPAFAHDLAASGVPAVIGMRRLVDLTDTNLFCAALYPQVMRAIKTAVAADGPTELRIIDWAASLTAPRVSMSGDDPSLVDTWIDPVLYVQEELFKVAFTPVLPIQDPLEYARLRGQLDVWRGYLARLDPVTADPGVVNDVRAMIAMIDARLTSTAIPAQAVERELAT